MTGLSNIIPDNVCTPCVTYRNRQYPLYLRPVSSQPGEIFWIGCPPSRCLIIFRSLRRSKQVPEGAAKNVIPAYASLIIIDGWNLNQQIMVIFLLVTMQEQCAACRDGVDDDK